MTVGSLLSCRTPMIRGHRPVERVPITNEGRNISGPAHRPLTIASALSKLVAWADGWFGETELVGPFGILSCGFTAWSGVSCTLDETWVYRMLWNLGLHPWRQTTMDEFSAPPWTHI